MNIQDFISEAVSAWAPPRRVPLSEWAEENFRLSPEYSAATGKLYLFKFQREILDSFTDPYIREVCVMSATQMIKTLFLQTSIAYTIAVDPGPILFAQPTETDAETFSKERIAPMIRDMECLRGVVAAEKRTSSANTVLHKLFRGGSLSLIGANAAGNFARRSIRVFLGDEIDKWPANIGKNGRKEGDGWSLGVKRTATFRSRAKLARVCSPTIDGSSPIAAAYDLSDQRKFHVPCPHCGHLQILRWNQVRWQGNDPKTALYHCAECDRGIDDVERWAACESEDARWIAEQLSSGVAGFWISELYSPWKKLSDIVIDFLAKKDDRAQLQTFVNTSLAEVWREKGEAPDWERLKARAGGYELGTVPAEVLFLTAGIDIQKDRVEIYAWGWGRGKRSWLIDQKVIHGDTSRPEVWSELDSYLNVSWQHPAGPQIGLSHICIDSGYATTEVYQWARRHSAQRVTVTKGETSGVALVGLPSQSDTRSDGKRARYGIRVWPINVSMAKSELYGWLHLDFPEDGDTPPGWVACPVMEDEFYRQLTAEEFVTRIVKGYRRGEWVKTRERNEALDCRNYARAAAYRHGMDRWNDEQWALLEAQLPSVVAASAPLVAAPAAVIEAPPRPPQQKPAGWMSGRQGGWFRR